MADDPYKEWGPPRLRKFIRACKQAIPLAGHNTQIDRTSPEGSRIDAFGGGEGGNFAFADFSLYPAGNSLLGVDNGYVDGILPDGMTAGATRGNDDAYTMSVSGSGIAYLKVNVNTVGTPTGASIHTGTSKPANTSAAAYVTLGDFSETEGTVTIGAGSQGIGSQGFFSCGGNHYLYAA